MKGDLFIVITAMLAVNLVVAPMILLLALFFSRQRGEDGAWETQDGTEEK